MTLKDRQTSVGRWRLRCAPRPHGLVVASRDSRRYPMTLHCCINQGLHCCGSGGRPTWLRDSVTFGPRPRYTETIFTMFGKINNNLRMLWDADFQLPVRTISRPWETKLALPPSWNAKGFTWKPSASHAHKQTHTLACQG